MMAAQLLHLLFREIWTVDGGNIRRLRRREDPESGKELVTGREPRFICRLYDTNTTKYKSQLDNH